MIIKNLKTIAVAMLAAGATVSAANAAKVVPIATNVLQSVTATLTIYEPGTKGSTAVVATASLKTANILTAVENTLGGTFSKKATLGYATVPVVLVTNVTTNISGFTTNVTTNVVNVPTTLNFTTNVEVLTGATNILGVATNQTDTNGVVTNIVGINTNVVVGAVTTNHVRIGTYGYENIYIDATNGTTNIAINTPGPNGETRTYVPFNPVTLSSSNVTFDNTTLTVAPHATFDGNTINIDGESVTVTTNGVGVSNSPTAVSPLAIGTNAVSISSTSNNVTVTVGTNVLTATNTATITNLVTIGSDVIVSNGVAYGLGTNSSLTAAITTSFNVVATNYIVLTTNTVNLTNDVVTTNEVIVTNIVSMDQTTDYTATTETNTTITTNFTHVVSTNEGSAGFVVADQGTNTPIPTNILAVVEVGTNDISAAKGAITTGYTVDSLLLNATNLTLKLQGLNKSTSQAVTLVKGTVVTVTNQAWTDVSGYGTDAGFPVVAGGTISIAAPAKQLVP